MSIGDKRNFLISKATGDYLAHFDTDDFYHREYLSSSIFNLIKSGKGLSGSSDMLMLDTANNNTYKQRCINMDMINEATIKKNKFSNKMSSEGILFCDIKDLVETPIENIMICLAHQNNTVNKKQWINDKYKSAVDLTLYKRHLEILSSTNIYG
jgi:hypothetical protein